MSILCAFTPPQFFTFYLPPALVLLLKTALHHHQDSEGHQFDFEGVKILASEKRYFPRLLLEMINILKRRDKVCNYRADVDGLCAAYHQFFLPERAGD